MATQLPHKLGFAHNAAPAKPHSWDGHSLYLSVFIQITFATQTACSLGPKSCSYRFRSLHRIFGKFCSFFFQKSIICHTGVSRYQILPRTIKCTWAEVIPNKPARGILSGISEQHCTTRWTEPIKTFAANCKKNGPIFDGP